MELKLTFLLVFLYARDSYGTQCTNGGELLIVDGIPQMCGNQTVGSPCVQNANYICTVTNGHTPTPQHICCTPSRCLAQQTPVFVNGQIQTCFFIGSDDAVCNGGVCTRDQLNQFGGGVCCSQIERCPAGKTRVNSAFDPKQIQTCFLVNQPDAICGADGRCEPDPVNNVSGVCCRPDTSTFNGTNATNCTFVKTLNDGVSADKLGFQPGVAKIGQASTFDECVTQCNAQDACTSFLMGTDICLMYSGVVGTTKLHVPSIVNHATYIHYVKTCFGAQAYTGCVYTRTRTKITVPMTAVDSFVTNFLPNMDSCQEMCLMNAKGPDDPDCEAYSALSAGTTDCRLYHGIDHSSIIGYSGTPNPTNGHDLYEENCTMYQLTQPCEYSEWSPWSPCTVTCGGGEQIRSRLITVGSTACQDLTQTTECNTISCGPAGSTPCVYGPWGAWSGWTPACGSGVDYPQTRERTIATQPTNGGAPCDTALLIDSRFPDLPPCAAGCNYTDWSAWTACSATCGSGVQTRTRATAGGGPSCPNGGQLLTMNGVAVSCHDQPLGAACVQNANYWCTATDYYIVPGDYAQRICCSNTSATNTGGSCASPQLSESRPCTSGIACECVYTAWSQWSDCSVSCVNGVCTGDSRTRWRKVLGAANNPQCDQLIQNASCNITDPYTCMPVSTITGVKPSLQYSAYTKLLHNHADCKAACESNTDFKCNAYLWAGVGSHCYLYGDVTTNVDVVPGSPFILTICSGNSGSVCLNFNYCEN